VMFDPIIMFHPAAQRKTPLSFPGFCFRTVRSAYQGFKPERRAA
jgi:hypothetical protein